MRDPKTVRDAIVMEQIEIIDGDLYDIPSRHINNDVLVIHLKGAIEMRSPIVLATQDCDEEEKEILAYRVAKEISEGSDYRYSPRKVDENYYILERVQ